MTNGELIKQLSQYPKECKVNFWLFSNISMRRGEVQDNDFMLRQSRVDNEVCIMFNLPHYFEQDIVESQKKLEKAINEKDSNIPCTSGCPSLR